MEYKISQLFSLLINNGIFCFIEKEHNCFKCKFKDLKIKFIAYFIQLEILKADIKSFLEKKFKNNFIPKLHKKNYKTIININYIFLRIISNNGKIGDIIFIMISGYFSIKKLDFHYYKFYINCF